MVNTEKPLWDSWQSALHGKLKVTVHRTLGTGSFFGTFRRSIPAHTKAEKSACPLAAEGDSPIFAAKREYSKKHALAAAKIGTVPCQDTHSSFQGAMK
jgi:hypothetical protein